ncbi:hypothetical protein DSL72_006305 [Monilinia vaccinii-corymbosi]|uniref:Nineteen complex-related protein 2 domain-containing protein n=1 Tax=Monilinia vaccinii-corymbosi TaxID=61207 RepID=A0A8A3PM36_9HELO|nr:hypothetical protein DSL72_006305 [Monilinia vaccinii-corymbosi]
MSAVRKPLKKSNLRRSIAFDDLMQDGDDTPQNNTAGDDGPTSKPPMVRTASFKKKKRPAASRLSFGVGDIVSGSDAEELEEEAFTPVKKALSRKAADGNAKKKNAKLPLPMRARDGDEDGDGDSGMGRPTYSKDYLEELKSSQATAMKELAEVEVGGGEEPFLDASELEGAMVVDSEGNGDTVGGFGGSAASIIPTEAEIREKKARRARMARDKDFISLNDDEPDGGRHTSLLPRQKKAESRLVREDEEIMEGFEEFVDDGRISLGKKQEREDQLRRKKEMADLIQQAEGSSDEESDDSEAERRAAYEAAQTRAGMDGLHKHDDAAAAREESQVPGRIAPIPVLSECLERLQHTLRTMELELSQRRRKIEEGQKEKSDIVKREREVQVLLTQAGQRYSALRADARVKEVEMSDVKGLVEKSDEMARERIGGGDRGLESFGSTPIGGGEMVDG